MPQLAFSTLACPDWSWETILASAQSFRFDGIEVRQIAGETDLLKIPGLRSVNRSTRRSELHQSGVAVCGLASSVRFDYLQERESEEQLQIGKAYVELAAELEASFVRVFGDMLPDASQPAERAGMLARIVEGLNRLGEFAGRHKIDILLETHGDFSESSLMKQLFQQIEAPSVGVLWDTHHPWRFFNEPAEATLANFKRWMRHTHWKDSVAAPSGQPAGHSEAGTRAGAAAQALMSGHRHADYVLFGGGEFPISKFTGVLKNCGYEGWLCLEWEKMWHPELAPPEIALPLFPPKMRFYWDTARVSDNR